MSTTMSDPRSKAGGPAVSSIMRAFAIALTMSAVFAPAASAQADPVAKAAEAGDRNRDELEADRVQRLLDKEGFLQSIRQNHADALKLNTEKPNPQHMAGLAEQEANLGFWVRAADHMDRVLESSDKWVDLNRDLLERRRANIREHVGFVYVEGPAGSVIAVDGVVRGMLPMPGPLNVLVGEVTVTYALEGKPTRIEHVTVHGGLVPEFVRPTELYGAAAAAGTQAMVLTASLPPTPPAADSWHSTVGKVLLVLSVPAYVAGGYLLAKNGQPTCDPPANGGWVCVNKYNTLPAGLGLLGIGLAADVAGGLLLFSAPAREIRVSVGPTGLAAGGRF
jgi:hypothetical protein